ncbi:MAG: PGF-CTERM sorting domain-containing protein [Candidatus Methanogasteraceae archaeon]
MKKITIALLVTCVTIAIISGAAEIVTVSDNTTAMAQPGFGAAIAVVGLLAALLIARRQK